eukprot:TRINITY_DN8169_c0_g1_i1.p2 TRINITY_DN8169_c0_g1~~TRINITY_DN8169_c0_g1_i1.p2  ORF type:complete len:168 (+),score=46.06 TRINITY_DN8169_c0_g1_i1:193-696(+)
MSANCWYFVCSSCRVLVLTLGAGALALSQTVATFFAVYGFRGYPDPERAFRGCGWPWAVVVWVYSLIWMAPMDFVKMGSRNLMRHVGDELAKSKWAPKLEHLLRRAPKTTQQKAHAEKPLQRPAYQLLPHLKRFTLRFHPGQAPLLDRERLEEVAVVHPPPAHSFGR